MLQSTQSMHKDVKMQTFMEFVDHLIRDKHVPSYSKICRDDKLMLTALFYQELPIGEQRDTLAKSDRDFTYARLATSTLMNLVRPLDLIVAIQENFLLHFEDRVSELFNSVLIKEQLDEQKFWNDYAGVKYG